MTEKRFKLGIHSPNDISTICDMKDGFEYKIDDVVYILNSLNEENEQLKRQLNFRKWVGKSAQIMTRSDWEDL